MKSLKYLSEVSGLELIEKCQLTAGFRGAVAHMEAAGRRGGGPLLSSLHDCQVILLIDAIMR